MLFSDNQHKWICKDEYIYSAIPLSNPPFFSHIRFMSLSFAYFTTPLPYLEIPFLVIVVRISIHSRPWLVVNCSPLAAQPTPKTPMDQVMFT